jgi:hypothetical protein
MADSGHRQPWQADAWRALPRSCPLQGAFLNYEATTAVWAIYKDGFSITHTRMSFVSHFSVILSIMVNCAMQKGLAIQQGDF